MFDDQYEFSKSPGIPENLQSQRDVWNIFWKYRDFSVWNNKIRINIYIYSSKLSVKVFMSYQKIQ